MKFAKIYNEKSSEFWSLFQHMVNMYISWVPRTQWGSIQWLYKWFIQINITLWCKNMMILIVTYRVLQVYLNLCMTVFFVIIRDYNCICIFGVKVDRNLTFITLYNNFNLWNKLLNKINDIKSISNTYQSVITGITWSQWNATEKY